MKKRTIISVIVTALLLLLISGIASAESGLTKISDTVYAYVDTKNSTPAKSFGANAGIIIGRDGVLVVDTLVSAKEARQFIADIKKVTDRPIKYVVNTHYHLDHAFGNAEFRKLGAVIIAEADDDANLRKNGEPTLKGASGYGLTASDLEGTELAYPDLSFTERMGIDLGDQKVELIYPGASHTNGSIVVYLPQQKILFSGDVLFTGYHPFLAEGDIDSWLKVLDRLAQMDVVTIIPGHGPVSSKKDLADMKDYLMTFDTNAKRLSAGSNDIEYVFGEMKKVLPQRAEAGWLIKANLQMKYMKESKGEK